MSQLFTGQPGGLPLPVRYIIITDMSIFISFWEYLILLPKEIRIWKQVLTNGRANPPGWFCLVLRYLILTQAIVIIENTYASNFKTNTACKVVAVIDGMAGILLAAVRSCALAWRANAVSIATLSSEKGRFSTLRLVQYALLITLLGTISSTAASFWDFYVHLGGWTSRVDPLSGSCFDPRGIRGAINGPSSSLFWGSVVTTAFELSCVIAVILSMRRIRSSWGLSKFVAAFSTHSFGYFALAFVLGVILVILSLVENEMAPVLSKAFFTLVNVLVVRIMIQEQSILMKRVRYSETSPSNKEIIIPQPSDPTSSSKKSIKDRIRESAKRSRSNIDKDLERQQGITIEREEIIDLDCFEETHSSPILEHYPSLSRGRGKVQSEGGTQHRDSAGSLNSFSNYIVQKEADDDASSQASGRWPGLERGRRDHVDEDKTRPSTD